MTDVKILKEQGVHNKHITNKARFKEPINYLKNQLSSLIHPRNIDFYT